MWVALAPPSPREGEGRSEPGVPAMPYARSGMNGEGA